MTTPSDKSLRAKLEEIASVLDKSLGDSDITHIENDDELCVFAPVQWACSEINKLLALSHVATPAEPWKDCAFYFCGQGGECLHKDDCHGAGKWRADSAPSSIAPSTKAWSEMSPAERAAYNAGVASVSAIGPSKFRNAVVEECAKIADECRVLLSGDFYLSTEVAQEAGRDIARQIRALKASATTDGTAKP